MAVTEAARKGGRMGRRRTAARLTGTAAAFCARSPGSVPSWAEAKGLPQEGLQHSSFRDRAGSEIQGEETLAAGSWKKAMAFLDIPNTALEERRREDRLLLPGPDGFRRGGSSPPQTAPRDVPLQADPWSRAISARAISFSSGHTPGFRRT